MNKIKSLIFDCDGVILNSNKIKTNAFREALKDFNENAVNEFIAYHNTNGGISRFIKIKIFLEKILPKYDTNNYFSSNQYELIINNYSKFCRRHLYNCEVTKDLEILKEYTKGTNWFIISGGDQKELRDVFLHKKLNFLFEGGIYGSPDTKDEILKREIKRQNIIFPALFLGDSKLDHIAAKDNKIEFVFVSKWTELKSYKKYCLENKLTEISKVIDIKNLLIDQF